MWLVYSPVVKIARTLGHTALSIVSIVLFMCPIVSADPPGYPYSAHRRMNSAAFETAIKDLQIQIDPQILKKWKASLNRASLYQDIIQFFSAKTHFDNCCIEEGVRQINQLRRDIDSEYEKLKYEKSKDKRDRIRGKILFKSGRIVHSVQDFFSHSSFVEMMQERYKEIEAVPRVDLWSEKGQKAILELVGSGLVSDRFVLSFPRKCNARQNVELAKGQS